MVTRTKKGPLSPGTAALGVLALHGLLACMCGPLAGTGSRASGRPPEGIEAPESGSLVVRGVALWAENSPLIYDPLDTDTAASAPEVYEVNFSEGRVSDWSRLDLHRAVQETWTVTYDERGRRSAIHHQAQSGQGDWSMTLSWVDDDEVTARKSGTRGEAIAVEQGCMGLTVRYLDEGLQERHCTDEVGTPTPFSKTTDSVVSAIQSDPVTGLQLTEAQLSLGGESRSVIEYERDLNGCVIARRDFGAEGVLTKGWRYEVNRVCRVLSGQMTQPGALGYRYTNDDNGCMVERSYVTTDGNPAMDPALGVGLVRWTRDEACAVLSEAYYEANGTPVEIGMPRVHLIRWTRNDAGKPLSKTLFDQNREPIADAKGAHATEWQYDDNNCVSQVAVFDVNREATTSVHGVHVTRYLNSPSCVVELEAYYNRSGKPTKGFLAAYQIKSTHNDKGQVTSTRYLDQKGRPMRATGTKIYGVENEFDEKGRQLALQYVSADGGPYKGLGGYGRREWSYQTDGSWSHRYLWNDMPVAVARGHHFNGQAGEDAILVGGRVTTCTFVGKDGAPVDASFPAMPMSGMKTLTAGRVRRIEFSYNGSGRLTEQAFYRGESALPDRLVSCSEYPCVDDSCLNLIDRR